ncbi:UNVERIFIED_CONTAM: hypothetical protein HHA_449330 [Hammondia hammondi]|eukprot:XP_008881980.1 hypothetical protein HHA_449330 [Hammondia hammondi]
MGGQTYTTPINSVCIGSNHDFSNSELEAELAKTLMRAAPEHPVNEEDFKTESEWKCCRALSAVIPALFCCQLPKHNRVPFAATGFTVQNTLIRRVHAETCKFTEAKQSD